MRKTNNRNKKLFMVTGVLLASALALTACGSSSSTTATTEVDETETVSTTAAIASDAFSLDTTDLFTSRDLTQSADLSSSETLTVADGEDIYITTEGVYVITGTASEVTIYVETDKESKVQLVLKDAQITNTDSPVIYVTSADKVFVTTLEDSSLSVTGAFDETDSADAVIYSADDLVLNGVGTLTISSTEEGVYSKDDLKITGGTYVITSGTSALKANDSVLIADGDLTINAGTDGLHAENSSDDSLGYIYIADGTINITCGDDAIHGTSFVVIDGGTINLDAYEGIEGTYIQINGGELTINAVDDAVNAGQKSSAYTPTIEITGGTITITEESEKTDALDSNGDLLISGGTIDITSDSAFDYEGNVSLTGGTVTLNGEVVTELTPSDY